MAVRWEAIGSDGANIDMICDQGAYYGTGIYTNMETGTTKSYSLTVSGDSSRNMKDVSIPMSRYESGMNLWASSGTLKVNLQVLNSDGLRYFYIKSGYAHLALDIVADISAVPSGTGVDFTITVTFPAKVITEYKMARILPTLKIIYQ